MSQQIEAAESAAMGQDSRETQQKMVDAGLGSVLGAVATPFVGAYVGSRMWKEHPYWGAAAGFVAGTAVQVAGGPVAGAVVGAVAGYNTDVMDAGSRLMDHVTAEFRGEKPTPRPGV